MHVEGQGQWEQVPTYGHVGYVSAAVLGFKTRERPFRELGDGLLIAAVLLVVAGAGLARRGGRAEAWATVAVLVGLALCVAAPLLRRVAGREHLDPQLAEMIVVVEAMETRLVGFDRKDRPPTEAEGQRQCETMLPGGPVAYRVVYRTIPERPGFELVLTDPAHPGREVPSSWLGPDGWYGTNDDRYLGVNTMCELLKLLGRPLPPSFSQRGQ